MPYPNIVVWTLGAAGSAGKASLLLVAGAGPPPPPVLLTGVEEPEARALDVEDPAAAETAGCVPPIQSGADLPADGLLELGSAGKAADEDAAGALDWPDHCTLLGAVVAAEAEPGTLAPPLPLRACVLFFSLRTLVVCLSRVPAPAPVPGCNVGPEAAAPAHPLELVVAPCMPPSPGKLG